MSCITPKSASATSLPRKRRICTERMAVAKRPAAIASIEAHHRGDRHHQPALEGKARGLPAEWLARALPERGAACDHRLLLASTLSVTDCFARPDCR